MSPQVTHPGVYVAGLTAEGRKIVGVSSSITVFIGRATKGPFNRAIKCKSIRARTRAASIPIAPTRRRVPVVLSFIDAIAVY